ncbi:50S ribosomal protein L6 [Chrysiogenes arsenatis]|uniref:50S ribosomal protein L6 n=1 Tax=Chrysiogenes arsenatis TaxID=309797 RepID=UPI000424F58F|nr:50S ribosomal protein L6 [Chrysiogenes arsenatis]
MSRIGNKPVEIPSGVSCTITKSTIVVKGPKGELTYSYNPKLEVVQEGNTIVINRPDDQRIYRSLHGLTRTLISNMVVGVSTGFKKSLELVGVGYRAALKGGNLEMTLGFSHPVIFTPPQGVTVEVEGQTKIHVSGSDRQQVGEVAAKIRFFRRPEPYKGKGVRYAGEKIRMKAGKSGKKK